MFMEKSDASRSTVTASAAEFHYSYDSTMATSRFFSSSVKAYVGRALRETGAALKLKGESEVRTLMLL